VAGPFELFAGAVGGYSLRLFRLSEQLLEHFGALHVLDSLFP